MSTRYASQSTTISKNIPDAPQAIPPVWSNAWTRPADWTALPSVTTSDTKFAGLVAVTNDSTNYITFTTAGSSLLYNIDWGDGTTQTGVGPGTILQHTYDYATLSSSVASAGYKMAVVTVTATAGTLLSFDLTKAPTNIGPSVAYAFKWLDIAFAGPNLISYTISGLVGTGTTPLLQQINIVRADTFYQPWIGNGATNGAVSLQNIILGSFSSPITGFINAFANTRLRTTVDLTSVNLSSSGINCQGMYANCGELVYAPNTPSTFKPTNMSNMFSACFSLISAPKMDVSLCTNASSTYSGCSALMNVPNFIMPLCTSISGMFSTCASLTVGPMIQVPSLSGTGVTNLYGGCTSLISTPVYNFNTATNINSMFSGCISLVSVGGIIGTSISTATTAFSGCTALTYIGILNFGTSLGSMSSMFLNCSALASIPAFNTSNVTAMDQAFSGCTRLTSLFNGFDTSSATTLASTFLGCSSLTSIPSLTTTLVTNLTNTFNGCIGLTSVPLLNTANVTTFANCFNGCNNLSSVPLFDMTKNTSLANTFQGCSSLISFPTYNTSNVVSFLGSFNSTNITTGPTLDTSKATTVNGMFTTCNSLNSIPTYNLANVTSSALTGFLSLPSLSNITMTGMKQAHNISNDKLGKIELENYFANYVGIPTGSTALTITGNPGADTANAKTSGTTAGSGVITMANTVGITANTFIYGTGVNTGIPVTFTDAGDTVVYTNGAGLNGLANGDNVLFTAITTTTGIVINTRYWVVNRTSTTFQVSATSGGTALALTTNGSGVMTIGGATISNRVASVVTNVSVTLSGVCGITNAAASLTARNLNTNQAVTKNWAITG